MPKTPSGKLFHLIKSLSGSEKRYFKIFISGKEAGNSKYAKLFDAIDGQVKFDDNELKKHIYGNKPVETRKYSELKAYLYDLVLKGLQSYDEKSSVDYRLKNLLLGIRTLFKRSHFEDGKDLLKKAKKLAIEYEDFNVLIDILDLEKKIAYAQMDIGFLDRELKRITDEEKMYIEKLTNISSYRIIFFKILVSIRKDASRSQSQIEAHQAWMNDPLMQDEKFALSHKAKMLFYRIKSIYYFSTSDFQAFYSSGNKLIKIIEEKPNLLKEDVSEYISALNNYIVSCGMLGKYQEVQKTLEKLAKVKPVTIDDELKIHRQYYNNMFRLCITTGNFSRGKMELEKHLKEIEKFDKKVFLKSDFYFQYFCIYFGNEDYETALNNLNEWLGTSKGVERKDLQSLARILNLIIHYELGNTMLLDSLLRSTYRFLNKENRLSELERKFMNFIKEASKPQSKRETQEALKTLKQDFESLSKLPSYKIFDLFDINSWLESKISRKSFAEVVQEKFTNQNLP